MLCDSELVICEMCRRELEQCEDIFSVRKMFLVKSCRDECTVVDLALKI